MKNLLTFLSIIFSAFLFSCIITSDDDDTKTVEMAAALGMSECFKCHITGGIANTEGNFTEAYKDWLEGPHGNFNYYNDETYSLTRYEDFLLGTYPDDYVNYSGLPNETFMDEEVASDTEDEFESKADCLVCHGPSSLDNSAIASLALVDSGGAIDTAHSTQVARPVVGCEQCHGNGSLHKEDDKTTEFDKEPGASACKKCHSVEFPEGHLTYHPMGAGGLDNPGIFMSREHMLITLTMRNA